MGPTHIVPRSATGRAHEELQAAHGTLDEPDTLSSFTEQAVSSGPLSAGDIVLMDSRSLHFGAANQSGSRRVLLDFAFVNPRAVPSTYCECIQSAIGSQRLRTAAILDSGSL